MLFKNTVKAASAAALWMVALLGANSAMAQLPTYSAETLTGGGPTYPIELPTPLPSAAVDVNEDAQFALQNAAAAPNDVWIRVSATGVLRLPMVATSAPTVQIGSKATPTATPTFSGTGVGTAEATTSGSAFIYQVTGREGTDPISSIQAALQAVGGTAPDDASVTGMGAGGFTVSVHKTKEDANFGRSALVSGGKNALMVMSSVTAEGKSIATVDNVASAISRFTSIKGMENATRPYQINLGGFDINVMESHLRASDGATLSSIADGPDGDRTATGDNVNLWTVPRGERWDAVLRYRRVGLCPRLPPCGPTGGGDCWALQRSWSGEYRYRTCRRQWRGDRVKPAE